MATEDGAPAPPRRSLAQSVFRQGALYAVAGVTSQAISFVLFPFFAHVFTPRQYGILDLVLVITTIVNLTVALEIKQGLGRHFAEAGTVDDRRGYASSAMVFALGAYTLFGVVVLLAAGPLTNLIFGEEVSPTILRIAAWSFWFNGLGYIALDLLRWQLRPKWYAAAAVTQTLVLAITSAVLVLIFDMGVEGAVIGQLVGFAAGGALAYSASRDLFRMRVDRAKLRQMLAYSVPLVPASSGVFLNGYADRIAIQVRMGLDEVGLYGVGYRLSLVVGLTLIGFQGALMPQILVRYREAETPRDLARVFRLFCALALGVLLGISTFADELLRILTRAAYYGAEAVVPYVVAAAFFAGMYMFAPGLNIAKRTGTFAIIAITGGIVNLGLAFALVGPFGIEGAALSFLLTQAAAFTGYMVFSQRIYPVPHQWRRLAIGATAIAALTVLGWKLPAAEDHAWALAAKLVVVAAGALFLAAWMLDDDERAMGRRVIGERVRAARQPASSQAS